MKKRWIEPGRKWGGNRNINKRRLELRKERMMDERELYGRRRDKMNKRKKNELKRERRYGRIIKIKRNGKMYLQKQRALDKSERGKEERKEERKGC